MADEKATDFEINPDDIDIDLGNEWVSVVSINEDTVKRFKEYTVNQLAGLEPEEIREVLSSRQRIQEHLDGVYADAVKNTYEDDDLLQDLLSLHKKNLKWIEIATTILEKKIEAGVADAEETKEEAKKE